jgi:hypothetical protein
LGDGKLLKKYRREIYIAASIFWIIVFKSSSKTGVAGAVFAPPEPPSGV